MDQEKPEIVPTEISGQPEGGESGKEWSSTEISSVPPVASEPPTFSEPPSSTIAVSSQNGNVPKWLYLVFGVIVVIFIVMTTFLVKTLLQGKLFSPVAPTPGLPTVTKTAVTIIPSLTPVPTEVVDPVVNQLQQMGISDEVNDLESDIKNTDLSLLDQSISTLDAQLGFTSQKK